MRAISSLLAGQRLARIATCGRCGRGGAGAVGRDDEEVSERNPGLLRLQEALRSLEQAAVAARKRRRLPWSRRAAALDAKRAYGAAHLDARRIGEWLGKPGRAPRDPDQVWTLVRVWSEWGGEGPGRQDRRYWNQLVALAQPLPRAAANRDDTPLPAGSTSRTGPSAEPNRSVSSEVREPDQKVRRLWLPLENGVFPFPQDTANARGSFVARLLDALIESFGDRPVRFTLPLRVRVRHSVEPAIAYEVWCHHRELIARAARRHREHMTKIIDARLQASDVDAIRGALLREIAESEQAIANWRIEGMAIFLEDPVPHTITYEPSMSRLRFEAGPIRGTDPESYDDKVSTTSEALAFACSVSGRGVVFLGDPIRYSGNHALVKLITHMLDKHELDFTRFRVAQDDPEAWDFRYP